MSTRILRAALGAALYLMVSVPAMGSERDHREHGAHAHGHGVLEIAVDGEALVIALRIPAVNVVGFEHEAASEEQRHLVADAIARFGKGDALFAPSKAARCILEEAHVELAGMHGGEGEQHGEKHAEKHEEKHDARHEHGAAGTHDESSTSGHSEMHAEYHFHCHAPDQLAVIDVAVFAQLRDAEVIDAHVVTAMHQGAVELTPGHTTVSLVP